MITVVVRSENWCPRRESNSFLTHTKGVYYQCTTRALKLLYSAVYLQHLDIRVQLHSNGPNVFLYAAPFATSARRATFDAIRFQNFPEGCTCALTQPSRRKIFRLPSRRRGVFMHAPIWLNQWQVPRDSNPHQRFWRAVCCRYTRDLFELHTNLLDRILLLDCRKLGIICNAPALDCFDESRPHFFDTVHKALLNLRLHL